MGLISNGTTIFDAGALDSGQSTGAMTHIKTLTASSSGTLSFVHGASSVVLDGTYKEYVFKFINIHPATDSTEFGVGFRDGGTAYDATKTTTAFNPYHNESDDGAGLYYREAWDLAQGTGDQIIAQELGNGNDECASGFLHLYDPANTTFVKHFVGITNYYQAFGQTGSFGVHYAGYCNVTAAIDGVQFKMSSGNIDSGTIKLYGIK
jgi:hypothetical protein